MVTRVFQVLITDERADEVNAAGCWSKVAWGDTYLKLTSGGVDDFDELAITIAKAVGLGLIVETRFMDTDNLDEVFAIGNGYGDTSKEIMLAAQAKSVSVGDILIKNSQVGGGTGYIVAKFGFDELPADVTNMITTSG